MDTAKFHQLRHSVEGVDNPIDVEQGEGVLSPFKPNLL